MNTASQAREQEHSLDSLKEILRERGLKATNSRLKVLAVLRDMGGHRSADDICQTLEQQGDALPRGSVFKVVGDLARHDILMVTDAGPGRTLYEYNSHWHHHFVCRTCGIILDVPCVEGTKPCLLPEADVPATIEEAQIIFRGICDECKASSQPQG